MRDLVRHWITRFGLDGMPRLRKTLVAIIGITILLFGLALIVLPGPAFIVIPLGLVVLASEFAWARLVLKRGKLLVDKVRRRPRPEKSAKHVFNR